MDIFRVAFIGHREVDDFRLVEMRLEEIIGNLIDTKEYLEFYVGRNGEFDIMVASAIKRAQRDFGNANNSLILVLPYPVADEEYYQDFYDEILYPAELHKVHYKAAITKRNEWFISNSDLLIAYVVRDYGGAYECLKKAEKANKDIEYIVSKK